MRTWMGWSAKHKWVSRANAPPRRVDRPRLGRADRRELRSLRELLWRDFRADLLILVSILLIICGASWGLMRWQLNRVQNLLETQGALRLEIAQARTALDQLQAETWGVWLHEESDGMR